VLGKILGYFIGEAIILIGRTWRWYGREFRLSRTRLLGKRGYGAATKATVLIFIPLLLAFQIFMPGWSIIAPVVGAVLLVFSLISVHERQKDQAAAPAALPDEAVLMPLEAEELQPEPVPQPLASVPGQPEVDPVEEEEPPQVPARSTEEILAELDAMIGLADVKRQVRDWIADQAVVVERNRRGLLDEVRDYTLKLIGPPGTGKTETARLLGELFHSLELLPSGHLVELQRADIIGEWQGHSANAMKRLFIQAMGGVLFIDEVHSLVIGDGGDTFGREIVSTLVKLMEDNRGKIAVIIAGYSDEVEAFLKRDPGLESRFLDEIYYLPYSVPELVAITDFQLDREGGRYLSPDAHNHVKAIWEQLMGDPKRDQRTWGNGREARKLVQYMVRAQSRRLHPSIDEVLPDDEFQEVTLTDVVDAWGMYDGDDPDVED